MNVSRINMENRVIFIDLFRAFGIILMIMGHIKFGASFDKWIHGFHMPMFFFVSGWFFQSRPDSSLKETVLIRIRTLLLPYFFFESIQWAVCCIFIREYRNLDTIIHILVDNTFKIPIDSGTFGISPIPGAMWFLTAMFFIEPVYMILDRLLKNICKLHIAVIIICLIGMSAPLFLPFRLPWALDASFTGIGFFHLARWIKERNHEKVLNLNIWKTIILAVLFSTLIMISPKVNMRLGEYGWFFPFFINAMGMIIVMWNISKYIELINSLDNCIIRGIINWLTGIGRDSVVYLCLNQFVILFVTKMLYIMDFNWVFMKLSILIVTMIVLFVSEYLICNTRLKYVIGR